MDKDMTFQIVLVPNHDVGPFLVPIPELLNSVQCEFRFSLRDIPTTPPPIADVDTTLGDLYQLKKRLKLRDEDLLVQYIGAPLASRSKGLANLFVAGSNITESPPRVAAVSTSFIRRHILPLDPTYLIQRHAFYHLLVCCLAGSYLELAAHDDHGCLLDFNNYTPNIQRKLEAGYLFCDSCATKVVEHELGQPLLDICAVFKDRASSLTFGAPTSGERPKVFLCYAGGDRDNVADLFRQLSADGFEPWMDKESLLPGQDWKLEIKRAINNADYFIACLSSLFHNRTFAHKEITLALDVLDELPEGQIYLIPARLEDCAIDDRLSGRQWVDLF